MKFKSSDFPFMAYCIARGATILDVDGGNPKRKVFELESDIEYEELKKEYFNNSNIPVKDFLNAQKTLKNFIFDFSK